MKGLLEVEDFMFFKSAFNSVEQQFVWIDFLTSLILNLCWQLFT